MSTFVRILGVVAFACAAVACGGPESGMPIVGQTTGQTATEQQTTTVPTTTSTKPTEVRLGRDNICDLLTPDEAARFGSKNPEPTNSFVTGNPQCNWDGEIGITAEFEFDGPPSLESNAKQIEVSGQEVALVPIDDPDAGPMCKTIMDVNAGRSFLVMAANVLSAGEGKGYDTCEVAKELAEIVIPKVKG